MDPVRKLWTDAKFKTKFTPPTILYAYNKTGEKFIVISDNKTIYRLMNAKGQVFMVAGFRCRKNQTNEYYTCDDPFHIVSCTKNILEEEDYANNLILPVVFKS